MLSEKKIGSDVEIAKILDVSESVVRMIRTRLSRRVDDISLYCPICFKRSLQDDDGFQVCVVCGGYFKKPSLVFERVFWGGDHEPAHHLHPDAGLGSFVNMNQLKSRKMIVSNPRYLEEKKVRATVFVEDCLSNFWSLLKGCDFDEKATDEMASELRKVAKRYARHLLGDEAIIDVLILFLSDIASDSKDHRVFVMADWLKKLKGRSIPVPRSQEIRLKVDSLTGKVTTI